MVRNSVKDISYKELKGAMADLKSFILPLASKWDDKYFAIFGI